MVAEPPNKDQPETEPDQETSWLAPDSSGTGPVETELAAAKTGAGVPWMLGGVLLVLVAAAAVYLSWPAWNQGLPGWLRSVDFSRVFRDEHAAPRFDVGHYRALANFEAVERDRRESGRALYFAGDHLVHPSPEGAVVSAERAAAALAEDLALV